MRGQEKANLLSDYCISGTVLDISNVSITHFLDIGRGNPQKYTATSKRSYKMTRVLDKTTSLDRMLLEDIQ